MSLVNQTVWVVGGVGVIGRGIARGLLKAGATVIVNSRAPERLEMIAHDLGYPPNNKLLLVHGSLLPSNTDINDMVSSTLENRVLHHVVAHGAVRYWTKKLADCDETFSLLDVKNDQGLLDTISNDDFTFASSRLASLHFSAAKALIPHLPNNNDKNTTSSSSSSSSSSSYTFVTGDGGGHSSGRRSAMGEINSHHVWGLAAAIREELTRTTKIRCREIRVEMNINRPTMERIHSPRNRPLSEDIGDLCAGLASHLDIPYDEGSLIRLSSQEELERYMVKYEVIEDTKAAASLPHIWEMAGSL
jgi:NAD(P)-dependent dehydrogenase (short-subunit alcohol dehydrogenase family)